MKKEPKASSTLTRRSFLTGAAAVSALAAAGLATGCAPQAKGETAGTEPQAASPAASASADAWLGEEPQITDADCAETIDTEVLVVGAGTAGYFAAASAAESGAKVLLIEKSASGNSVRSSALGAVGSRQQQEKGVRHRRCRHRERHGPLRSRSDRCTSRAPVGGELGRGG